MKYSYNWLQKHIKEKLPPVEMLKETIIFHAFEVEKIEEITISKKEDWILDIKVLPDRAHDCLSHFGLAREIAGLLNMTLVEIETTAITSAPLGLPVKVMSSMCREYTAIEFEGLKVEASVDWMRDALESVGMKSINNIVDITNYVLLDTGQPIHAYDKNKITGSINVRLSNENENITTLSNEEKILDSETMVIADDVSILALAGIKGGKRAEISEETTSIILEIANFDPVSIRKSSKRLGLVTDASKRFENEISPAISVSGAEMAVSLIQRITTGKMSGAYVYRQNNIDPRFLDFSLSDITRVLGDSVTEEIIERVLDQYKYTYKKENGIYKLSVPLERLDLTGAHDMAEEIGRVYGYDLIPPAKLPSHIKSASSDHSSVFQKIRAAREFLINEGYSEVMTYAFRKKGEVYISRGPSDKSALRSNLSQSLKESFEKNRLNAPLLGLSKIKLFEIGTVFLSDREELRVATIEDANMTEEEPLESFMSKHDIKIEEKYQNREIKTKTFTPWSVYPFIVRDIAVWINEDLKDKGQEDLERIIEDFARENCARSPVIFDKFTKGNKISIAFRLIFQAKDRTLRESEVEEKMDVLKAEINAQKIFEIR